MEPARNKLQLYTVSCISFYQLTHISLSSFLWDIGKQNSPRCDAAKRGVPSGTILFTYRNFLKNMK